MTPSLPIRPLLGACALALAVGLAGCETSPRASSSGQPTAARAPAAPAPATGPSRAYLHAQNLPSSGLALEGYCPVAYFAVNRPLLGKPEFSSVYEGVTYQFVNADAKAAFDAQPRKYLPAYGGWCAFGMAHGDKFPVDPRSFKIVDGRLLLFLKNEAVDASVLWEQADEAEQLQQADVNWSKVKG